MAGQGIGMFAAWAFGAGAFGSPTVLRRDEPEADLAGANSPDTTGKGLMRVEAADVLHASAAVDLLALLADGWWIQSEGLLDRRDVCQCEIAPVHGHGQ